MSSKVIYKDSSVVDYYAKESHLQRPEEGIINLLKDKLSSMKMLDIGIGGGRTTLHFANLVKTYEGIDYSEEMVIACNQRFSGKSNHISFKTCDARSMKIFQDNTFDFILFSYNGIDSISHDDRLKVLKEIHRVGKPGSYFFFSTHNLQCVHQIFEFKYQPFLYSERIDRSLLRWFKLRFIYNRGVNVKRLKSSQYAIINDGTHDYRLQMYYVNPVEQIKQLHQYGLFKDVQIYSLDGNEITNEMDLKSTEDNMVILSMCN